MQALVFIEAHGKAKAWSSIAADLGVEVDVVASGGHVCRFPRALFPVGIDLKADRQIDATRRVSPELRAALLASVARHPQARKIFIATDDDVEGDVIAFDLINLILEEFPDRAEHIWRLRPGAMTHVGVREAFSRASALIEHRDEIISAAIQGRARAVSDRWIGAAFSRQAGVPVGRVRSAILGAVALWNHDPRRVRPETGEITFQCRASGGGRPFFSRVRLDGSEDRTRFLRLSALAQRFKGRVIPGAVFTTQSIGAAIAPRFGSVQPFNTGGVLAHAARHHRIAPKDGMKGLQNAYLKGMISYPRTDAETLTRESSGRIATLAQACGLSDVDIRHMMEIAEPRPGGHEALHPTSGVTQADIDQLRRLVRRPILETRLEREPEELAQIMTALVARRCFEASRPITLERGHWKPDNGGGALNAAEVEILRDIEWERESSGGLPWGRDLITGQRQWPLASILLEGMMIEKIGRPSTYAAHVDVMEASGEILEGEFPALPRPSPRGVVTLKKAPRRIWDPKTCRMIEDCLENEGNALGEDVEAPLMARARHRVLSWFQNLPAEMQETLLLALRETPDRREPGVSARAVTFEDIDDSPLPEPSPFAAM